jgi:hypothetical protein
LVVKIAKVRFDDRTSIDDIDQRRPPRCPRKSSRSPALPSALTRVTYVHPEIYRRTRMEEDEREARWRMRDMENKDTG